MVLKLGAVMHGSGFLRWILVLILTQMPVSSAHGQLMIHGDGGGGSGSCTVRTGAFPVGFAAYQLGEKDANVMAEAVGSPHVFCDQLPKIGRFSMTVDIHDDALRMAPIAVRLVREVTAGDEVVRSWPAQVYPNGTVHVKVEFVHPGQYALLLTIDKGAPSPSAVVRIPLQVGKSETLAYLSIVVAGIVLLLGVTGYLRKRKR